MRWRIWIGAALALLGGGLLANYVRVLGQEPAFAPTTAVLWALGLLTLAGFALVGWGVWRGRGTT